MPIYDYKCRGCGNEFEEQASIDDRHEPCGEACEKCGDTGHIHLAFVGRSAVISGSTTTIRPDREFKDLLSHIKKKNHRSTLGNDAFGN